MKLSVVLKSLFDVFIFLGIWLIISSAYITILLLFPVNSWFYIACVLTASGILLMLKQNKETTQESWLKMIGLLLSAVPLLYYILLFLFKKNSYTVY